MSQKFCFRYVPETTVRNFARVTNAHMKLTFERIHRNPQASRFTRV
jgi:hypothetical protein